MGAVVRDAYGDRRGRRLGRSTPSSSRGGFSGDLRAGLPGRDKDSRDAALLALLELAQAPGNAAQLAQAGFPVPLSQIARGTPGAATRPAPPAANQPGAARRHA